MTRSLLTSITAVILSCIFSLKIQASTGPAWWDFEIDTNSVPVIDDPWDTPIGSTNPVYGISSSETEVTSEIRDLAHALQNDPVRIYEYVRDHVKYIPRFGVRQGALGTLISKQGGDLDQCSLLIALLLAADPSSDAHIVKAQVDYTKTFMGNLLDIPSGSVVNVLNYHGFDIANSGSNARLVHFWVEATLDGQNRVLDPAFLQTTRISGASITSLLGYSRSTFLTRATTGATIETDYVEDINYANITNDLRQFTTNLLSAIRDGYAAASVDEFLGYSHSTEQPVTSLPTNLPHKVQIIETSRVTYSDAPLPDSLFATVKVDHSACGINQTFKAYELAGKRVSITYAGANNIATLKIDGQTTATGSNTTGGNKYNCTLTLWTPWQGPYAPSGGSPTVKLTSGENYVVLADFDTASPGLLQRIRRQISRARAGGASSTSEAVLCGSLDLVGQQWVMEHRLSAQIVGKLQGAKAAYALCGGFVKQEDGYAVDLPVQSYRGYFTTAASADVFSAYRTAGLMGSAFEHAVLEQMQGSHKPAASTVKLLWKGNQDGHRTYLADSSNWSTIQTQVQNYASTDITWISGWLNHSSKKVMLPARGDHAIGDWQGAGYLAYQTGSSLSTAYVISGDLSGGASGFMGDMDAVAALEGLDLNVPGSGMDYVPTWGADPVDLFTGHLALSRPALAVGSSSPLGLDLSALYNSGQSDQKSTLGYGWRHSLDITATQISHPAPSAGLRQPADLVPMIVRSVIVGDLMKNELTLKGYLISSLVTQWQADQMTDNAVAVRSGNRTLEFVRMPDGTFNPPPGVTSQLIETNGLYRLYERFGREYRFNADGKLTSLLDADGNTQTLAYNSATNIQTVTDSNSRILTFAYSGDKVSGVTESAGGLSRSVSFAYTGDDLTTFTDADSKDWSYVYDADHQLLAVVDPLSQTTVSNFYNDAGQVVTQFNGYAEAWTFHVSGPWGTEIDPLGNTTTHYFASNGRNLGTEDALGNRTYNAYNGQGLLVTNIDANGNSTLLGYDADHNLTNRVDALDNEWTYEYDDEYRLIAQADPLGNIIRYEYDAEHHCTSISNALGEITTTYTTDGLPHVITDANGNQVTYTYDSYGNPERIARTDGGTVTNTWNARGELTVARDALGNETTYAYNNRGFLTSVTDDDGNEVSYVYNDAGLKTQVTDQRDNTITYTYTPTYEVSTITYPDGGSVSNTYDAANRLVAITDGEGNTTTISRDAAGRRIAVTDDLTHTVSLALDANGNLIAVTNARSHVVYSAFDALNRVTNTWDQVGSQTRRTISAFDSAGRLTSVTDPVLQTISYAHDALGRVTTVTRPDSATEHNGFDAVGNLLSCTNAKGVAVVRTTYDGMSRPLAQTNALDNGRSWTYDTAGNRLTRTDGNGDTTQYSFNDLNQLTGITYEDSSTANFSYDEAGNLLTASDSDATVGFGYDEMNRVSAATQSVLSVSSVVAYSYDKNGNRTGLTLPGSETVTYTYDDANRLSGLSSTLFGSSFTFTYNNADELTGITYPNGVTATYTRDDGGRITGLTYADGGTTHASRSYTYNALGQITKRTISAGFETTPPDTHQHFKNNAADQLTHLSRMDNYENPERWRDVGPGYHPAGTVSNITVGYNGMNLSSSFTWDYDGRLTGYSGEHQTNLWYTVPPVPSSLAYKYDALGGRVTRTGPTGGEKIHVLDHAAALKNVLVQRASNGTIERYYVYAPGFGLVAHIEADGTECYYHCDHLGSTILLTDDNGDVTDQFDYTPYGELLGRTGTTDTPYTFVGRHGVYWEGAALYHMKARYYRADLARFISADPIGIAGGVNLYAYANGDPMLWIDPEGKCGTQNRIEFNMPGYGEDQSYQIIGGNVRNLTVSGWDIAGAYTIQSTVAGVGSLPWVGQAMDVMTALDSRVGPVWRIAAVASVVIDSAAAGLLPNAAALRAGLRSSDDVLDAGTTLYRGVPSGTSRGNLAQQGVVRPRGTASGSDAYLTHVRGGEVAADVTSWTPDPRTARSFGDIVVEVDAGAVADQVVPHPAPSLYPHEQEILIRGPLYNVTRTQ